MSDHACCKAEAKFGNPPEDVFLAKSGFGGTEYLLPGLVTEANRRGISLGRVAELSSKNPATRYGLGTKGDIAVGLDADLALVDPDVEWTVRAEDSESSQDYTPFEGFQLTAAVKQTVLRGRTIAKDGHPVGKPQGRYLRRPI